MNGMKNMLEHILNKSENGEVSVVLQFDNGALAGELRRFEIDGIYELRAVMGKAPNDPRPNLVSHFFSPEAVSRVMVIHPESALPQIVRPPNNGGLVIPT
jgi:hypothetical protein